MVDFVDSAVVAITNNTDLTEAYHDFFEAYGKRLVETSQRIKPIEEKVKFAFLERMDTAVFNAIWEFETYYDQLYYKDSILTDVDYIKCLSINPFGKYMDYLLLVGEKDQRYLEWHDFILSMGDLSTSGGLWVVHDEYDFGLVENRILAAVYILRMEDSYETKLDRYFSEESHRSR